MGNAMVPGGYRIRCFGPAYVTLHLACSRRCCLPVLFTRRGRVQLRRSDDLRPCDHNADSRETSIVPKTLAVPTTYESTVRNVRVQTLNHFR